MADTASSDANSAPNFLILNPKKGKKRDILKYLVKNDVKSGMKFLESPEEEIKLNLVGHRFIVLVSVVIQLFLSLIENPLKYFGYTFESFLNLVCQNGGFCGLMSNFLQGKLKIPVRGTENYVTAIGQLDLRVDLHGYLWEKRDDSIASDIASVKVNMGNRDLMDLCVVAAKIAYENPKFIQNVVANNWKMHFVEFYDGWNEYQQRFNTQAFICCDKEKDANLIVVSFRGTNLFNTEGWSTHFDWSWYEVPEVGKFHIGFLEALGLGNRRHPTTFQAHLQKKSKNFFDLNADSEAEMMEWSNNGAYYAIAMKLKDLLKEHPHANFVLTGHCLGGALAVMFACVLVLQEEREILDRLLNIYTFGQPRIGDPQLATVMEAQLNYPVTRYFRVVYCNDIVPRIPFDDFIFGFKHFGNCLYYNSFYFGKFVYEEPNKNYFEKKNKTSMKVNAAWELLRSCMLKHAFGPDFQDTWVTTGLRLVGLMLPGFSAHNPVEYVNSVRLGRGRIAEETSLQSFDHTF